MNYDDIKRFLESRGIHVEEAGRIGDIGFVIGSAADIGKERGEKMDHRTRLGTAILEAFAKGLENGAQVDFIEVFNIMCKAYMALIKSQTKGDDKLLINPKTSNEIAYKVTMLMGEELAKLGIAQYYHPGKHYKEDLK